MYKYMILIINESFIKNHIKTFSHLIKNVPITSQLQHKIKIHFIQRRSSIKHVRRLTLNQSNFIFFNKIYSYQII